MAIATWTAFSPETSNLASGGGMDSKNNNTTNFIADLDNTADKDLYASFWAEFGSITPVAGGSVTLSLRRKRGSVYAENPCRQDTASITGTGTRAFPLEFQLQLPGPGVYGIYWTNNLGVLSAASGNALYRSDFNEDVP